MTDQIEPQFPKGTPEYEAYRAELKTELDKFAKGEDPYPYETDEDAPHVLTAAEVGLLREIARWRRNHGVTFFQWRRGVGFGRLTEWKVFVERTSDDPRRGMRQRNVTYEPETGRVLVTEDYYGDEVKPLPIASVAVTVDMLVALGFLPARFSSAYRGGWDAREEATDSDGALDLLTWSGLEPIGWAR